MRRARSRAPSRSGTPRTTPRRAPTRRSPRTSRRSTRRSMSSTCNVPFGEAQPEVQERGRRQLRRPRRDALPRSPGSPTSPTSATSRRWTAPRPSTSSPTTSSRPRRSTKFKGKTYAVPQVTDTLGLFYNKKMLKDAGVEVPKTFDELKKAAKKIKSKTGKTGLYLRGDDPYWFLPYPLRRGRRPRRRVREEGHRRRRAGRQGVHDDEGPGRLQGRRDRQPRDGQENMLKAFQDGNVAMIINGPWDIADAQRGQAVQATRTTWASPPSRPAAPQGGRRRAAGTSSVYAGTKNLRRRLRVRRST